MLKKGEQISIKGYRWIDKPRANNSGRGIGILVSEKIAQNTTENTSGEEHEQLEIIWIKIECRPKNIAIGAFYGPQENAKIGDVKGIYTTLSNQITQKATNSEVIIAGDFNAKLTINKINCNQQESRNDKLLKEIIENNNLITASLNSNSGNWTRVNRKKTDEKSVIDYILTTPGMAKSIQMLIIDEEGHLRVKGKHETDLDCFPLLLARHLADVSCYLISEAIRDVEQTTIQSWCQLRSMTQGNQHTEKAGKQTTGKDGNNLTKLYRKKAKKKNNHRNLWRSAENNYKNPKKHRKTFQEACRTGTEEEKITTKKKYFESQIKLHNIIEKAEAIKIENKLEEIHRKAKINQHLMERKKKS